MRQVHSLVEGEARCMPRAEHVSKQDVMTTCGWLVGKINESIGTLSKSIDLENQERMQAFVKGEIDQDALASSWKQPPPNMQSKNLRALASKFLKRQHYTKQGTNTSGNYLEFDDEKMVLCLV